MTKYETWQGTFYDGEKVVITRTGILGEVTTIEGTVRGKRYSRGSEYLILEDDNGKYYEIPLRAGYFDTIVSSGPIIATGPETTRPNATAEEPKRYSRVIR